MGKSRVMRDIAPDQVDRELLMEGRLKVCPFCAGTPITINRYNESTKIFRTLISCSQCMADVGANAITRDDARRLAVIKWDQRAHTGWRSDFDEAKRALRAAAPRADTEPPRDALDRILIKAMGWHPSENGPSFDETRNSLRDQLYALEKAIASATQPAAPDDDWEERGAADELRKAVIEECARISDGFHCGNCGMDGKCGEAIRALANKERT